MTPKNPEFATPEATSEEVAAALNLAVNQLDSRFPLLLANAGNWHLMVAVKSKTDLDAINYDDKALSAILSVSNAVTAHVFVAENKQLYYARNFCPTVGIPEDPATGAAAGAFASYLTHIGWLPEGKSEIKIVQGEAMGRPSRLTVEVLGRAAKVEKVQVSGTAVLSFKLESAIPAL